MRDIESSCQRLEGWGPVADDRFDFTLCFEYSVLFGVTHLVAFILLLARLVYLKSQCKPHGLGRTAWIYWPSQVCMVSVALLAVVIGICQATEGLDQSLVISAGYFSFGFTWFSAALLNHYEHLYTIRSSDFIFTNYVVSILIMVIHTRTLHLLLAPTNDLTEKSVISIIISITLVIGFVIEAWPRGNTKVQRASRDTAYEKANFFSQITFYFFQPIISLSVKRPLTMDDVSNQLPKSNTTNDCAPRLEYFWLKALQNSRRRNKISGKYSAPSLFRAIFRCNLSNVPVQILLRILRVIAGYSQPLVLSLLLKYFQDIQKESILPNYDGNPKDNTSLEYGLFLAGAMLFAGLSNGILVVASRQYCIVKGYETRSALIALIYKKALQLSPSARQKTTTGSIMNHMSVDADSWGDGMIYLSMWISLPMEIILGLLQLYWLMGWSAWIGMLVMVAMMPLQGWRAKVFGAMRSEKSSYMDERIRATTESLSAIKVIKLYAWEHPFLQKILAVRDLELNLLRRMGIISAIMSIVNSSSTVLICLATLSVFAVWGGPDFTPGELTPQVVFVSMTLFAMLKTPISSLTETTTSTVGLIVSTKRIEAFLLSEELDSEAIVRETNIYNANPDEPLVLIKNGTFSWTKSEVVDDCADETQGLLSALDGGTDGQETLRNIQLSIQRHSLAAIVGRVGQGKSSLLSAIIGEMYKSSGYAKVIGRIAYVPQQAWIFNATLRDNILFGKEFDIDRYDRIVYACGLLPDIEMLPAGDATEIGERGINLSGGQKQRVSLARAAYADADIYLLDDPLSAVDAHVDQHLWANLIGPQGFLKEKTRLLVTHGINHLHEVDQVVVLKDGQIIEDGSYDELLESQRVFYQLIKEFSVTHKMHDSTSKSSLSSSTTNDDSSMMGSKDSGVINQKTQDNVNRKKLEKKQSDGKLTTTERIDIGELRKGVVLAYLSAVSYKYVVLVIVLHILAKLCLVFINLWLKYWITTREETHKDGEEPLSLKLFLAVFVLLTLTQMVTTIFLYWITFAVAGIRASKQLHKNLVSRIMRLPPAYFDTTPLGRIINRVSSDMSAIDSRVPFKLFETTLQAVNLIASLAIVAFTTPVFLLALPFILTVYYYIQKYYLFASRPCKRGFQTTQSPIYQHFQETLGGISTIRAMGIQERFIQENAEKSDRHGNMFVAFAYCIRWLEIQTQLMSCLIVFFTALWFVLMSAGVIGKPTLSPASMGLALSFALNISHSLIFFTRNYCDLYTHLICVERVQEIVEMNTEAPLFTDPVSKTGRAIERGEWPPHQGTIQFIDYSTRYRPKLDLILKHVSFKVNSGEKIGIVGRTGAGKSSLTLALFRMIEAANSKWSKATDITDESPVNNDGDQASSHQSNSSDESIDGGRIEIDNIDISTLGLHDLRKHLAVIPQDPVLFAGSVRENLDPLGEFEDVVLWGALERSHLKSYVATLAEGLSYQVAQNGENFSVGQRSLMCLARALLRDSKILVLDEATSAVDVETDELIQKTIRTDFKDRTILTIAHRIKTVMDSDKILVLDQGRVVEYDSPNVLLHDENSVFYGLAKKAGEF